MKKKFRAGLAVVVAIIMTVTMFASSTGIDLVIINEPRAAGSSYEVTYSTTTASDLKETKDKTAVYFLEYIPLNNVTTTAKVEGWILGKNGNTVGDVTVVLNGKEYICTRAKRPDVQAVMPGFDVSQAGFKLEINATQLNNGANTLSIREYNTTISNGVATTTAGYNELYKGTVYAIKMDKTFFDWSWYYFKYHNSDSEVKKLGKDSEKLLEHYYTKGIKKGYSPCIGFDPEWYRKNNTDVADDNVSAYADFVKRCLDGNAYRELSPFLHLNYYRQSRKLTGKTSATVFSDFCNRGYKMDDSGEGNLTEQAKALKKMFAAKEYASENSDIKAQCGDGTTEQSAKKLWENWFGYSLADNNARVSSKQFDMAFYMKKYEIESAEKAFWRYIDSGYKDGEVTVQIVTPTPITPTPSPTPTPILADGDGSPSPEVPGGGTPTPVVPDGGTPTPEVPGGGTPTPVVPDGGTPTPEVPGGGTPTPVVPDGGTPTPVVPGEVSPTPVVPGGGTPIPEIPGQVTPTPAVPDEVTPTPKVSDEVTPTPKVPGKITPTPTIPDKVPPTPTITPVPISPDKVTPTPYIGSNTPSPVQPTARVTTRPTQPDKVTPTPHIGNATPTPIPDYDMPTDTPTPTKSTKIKKRQQIIVKPIKTSYAYGSKPFILNAKTTGNGTITYKSSSKQVAVVSSKGKVTIKGCGQTTLTIKASETKKYQASVTRKFTIRVVPAAVTGIKISSPSSKMIAYSWKRSKGVDGYQVYLGLENGKPLGSPHSYDKDKTSVKIKVNNGGKKYCMKIRGYKNVGGKTYYGAWSKMMSIKVK